MPYPFQLDDEISNDDLNKIVEGSLNLTTTAAQSVAGPVAFSSTLRLRRGAVMTGPLVLDKAGFVQLPVNTTGSRPLNPGAGCVAWNSTTTAFEIFDGTGWRTYLPSTAQDRVGVVPSTVLALVTGTTSATAIPLTWSAPLSGDSPIIYQIQYRVAGGTEWVDWGSPIPETFATIVGLPAGTRFDMQVLAINDFGFSTSAVTSATTGYIPPTSVTITVGTVTSTTSAITWTVSQGTGSIAYQVQYRVNGDSTWINSGTPTNALATTLTGLAAATEYDIQVVATNAGGSTPSALVHATTSSAATTAPNSPTGLTASAITAQSMTLSWTAPSTGTSPFAYTLQFAIHGSGSYSTIVVTTGTSFSVSGLIPATEFDFTVTATNSSGAATSAVTTATTAVLTAASTGLSGTQIVGGIASFPPEIVGPLVGTVVVTGSLAINDVEIFDPAQSGATIGLTVSCIGGTVSMTDSNGRAIAPTGQHIIAGYSNTLDAVQAALLSLVYTAPNAVQTDTISIKVTDSFGNSNTLAIPITVTLTASTPPNGGSIPTDGTGVVARRLAQFTNSVGVNIRLDDVASGYGNLASIENCINYLTVRVIRDSPTSADNTTHLPQIAQACGAKLILFIKQDNAANYPTYITHMQSIAGQTQSRVLALEGTDEPDTALIFGGYTTSYAAAGSEQGAVYALAKSYNPQLSVLGIAMGDSSRAGLVGDLTQSADYANVHLFPSAAPQFNGNSNVGLIQATVVDQQTQVNKPAIVSEFSYPIKDPPSATFFSSNTSAAYTLQFLLDAFNQGCVYSLYANLLDDSVNGPVGLFDVNYAPKKPAIAIRNLLTLLGDVNGNALTFTPGQLDYTVTGKPSGVNSQMGYSDALLQDSNGIFWLLMSNSQILNNLAQGNNDISVSPVNVHLSFGTATMTSVKIYDPFVSTTAVSTTNSVGSTGMTVSLPSRPLVIRIQHP